MKREVETASYRKKVRSFCYRGKAWHRERKNTRNDVVQSKRCRKKEMEFETTPYKKEWYMTKKER